MAVDERQAHRERLRHPHQRVVDRLVAVRVVLAPDLTDDAARLHVGAVGPQPELAHAEQDPALHGLEAVAGVGQRAGVDDAVRVLEEGAAHLLLDVDVDDPLGEVLGGGGVLLRLAMGWGSAPGSVGCRGPRRGSRPSSPRPAAGVWRRAEPARRGARRRGAPPARCGASPRPALASSPERDDPDDPPAVGDAERRAHGVRAAPRGPRRTGRRARRPRRRGAGPSPPSPCRCPSRAPASGRWTGRSTACRARRSGRGRRPGGTGGRRGPGRPRRRAARRPAACRHPSRPRTPHGRAGRAGRRSPSPG